MRFEKFELVSVDDPSARFSVVRREDEMKTSRFAPTESRMASFFPCKIVPPGVATPSVVERELLKWSAIIAALFRKVQNTKLIDASMNHIMWTTI